MAGIRAFIRSEAVKTPAREAAPLRRKPASPTASDAGFLA